jgi:hypothetical protein
MVLVLPKNAAVSAEVCRLSSRETFIGNAGFDELFAEYQKVLCDRKKLQGVA